MKNSKILMGISALLLAGASAFATKNTHRAAYWYISAGQCVSTTADKTCTVQGTGCLGTQGDSFGAQLYSNNTCTNSLRPS
ncbi:DUF6520 family protein [Chitinophaga sancti]|uniref:DUF6520 family protein n=1 Tax=Chitinophaga sancti TaxID=1004 RepID=UPI0039BE09ED